MNNKFGLLTDEGSYEKSFSRLDEFQRAAASSEDNNVVIRASAGSGKALRNGTKVLTNHGWKPIESITTKDAVAAEDGKFYAVLGIYPQGLKQVYKITFSDKNIIECSGDHIWTWQSSTDRNQHKNRWQNSTTEELLQLSNGHWDIYLPQSEAVDFPKVDVPLDPYLLGALLGNGNMPDKELVFTVAEEDLKEKIQSILAKYQCHLKYISQYDYSIQGPLGFGYHKIQNYIGASLRELGLTHHDSHNKFIPDVYKYNSQEIRLGILQGIIDTSGYCDGSLYDITLASKQLILDIQFICESLGFTATYSEKESYCGPVYRLRIKTSSRYPKIHTTQNKDSKWRQGQPSAHRTIQSIEKTNEFAEMTCIEVASPNHLYLTEHMIPTHNTSTLIAAISAYRYNNLNDKICAITYTRAARAEMEARLQELGVNDVDVTTIHVWARNRLNDLSIKYDFKIQILEEPQIRTILQEIIPTYLATARVKSVNLDILYTYIMGSKRINITENYRRTLNALELRYINYKRENNLYDFTDYPLYLYNVLTAYNETIQDIDALFVDEFQDVDETQLKIFDLVKAKKKFYIGDKWQCQPFGTKIKIRSKNGPIEKNIEDVEIGDPVVFYDQAQGYVSGGGLPHNAIIKKVTNIQHYSYKNDYLITITSENGLKSTYTSNHRTFVRFNRPQGKEAHAVYLMCDKNNRFRVGKIPLFYTGKTDKLSNPWRDKMRAEGCCKIWIVAVFDNDHDARVEEAHISYYYRIPQTCWQTNKVSWTEDDINYIYEGLNTFYGAMMCLQDRNLSIQYPLLDETVEWSKRCHFTSNASSEIYAINIIPEFMSCIVYGSKTNHKNLHAEKIIKVDKYFIPEDNPKYVCALEVEGGTYVADNIITHNSIYTFRGACGEVFEKLDGFQLYKLKCNYRSYQEIIDYATTVYMELLEKTQEEQDCYISEIMFSRDSHIKCARGNGGEVYIINPFGRVAQFGNHRTSLKAFDLFNRFMKLQPMILCRTNKQVKYVQSLGYFNVDTVHQAKGLEYKNVITLDSTINSLEDLNVAYVSMTRAEDGLLVINWQQFESWFKLFMNKSKLGGLE